MKKGIIGLMALALSATALSSENRVGVGLGLGVTDNIYQGVDSTSIPMPLLDINYGNFYAKGLTLGYYFYQDDMFAASLFLDPLAGFAVDADDLADGYNNIEDRDTQAMGGLRLDLRQGIAGIRTGVTAQFGGEGAQYGLSFFRPYSFGNGLIVVPSAHVKAYSKDYTDYYFGVTEQERRDNVFINEAYTPDMAYSFGVNLTTEYMFNHNLSFVTIFGLEKLSKEVKDSPIVEDDVVYILGAGFKYFF